MSANDEDKRVTEEAIQDISSNKLIKLYRLMQESNRRCGFGRLKRRAFSRWFLKPKIWPKEIHEGCVSSKNAKVLVEILHTRARENVP